MKAKNIMIQGCSSSVGKSLIAAALCRIFLQDGYRVAPFKSQNMALNSYITEEGLEMGRAQVVQAEASGLKPSVLMNPILLKPTTDRKSQVILQGKVHRNMSATEYYEFKPKLESIVMESYKELEKDFQVIVLEGAGSPAEINLRENDIVNMRMAELVDAPVLLVGDIDRGGVFAALAGTMLLLREEEKLRVRGVIINKFRGDLSILKPGLKMIEDIINVPVLGVVPYLNLNIDDEDSVTERFESAQAFSPAPPGREIKVEIIHLPRMSNFTDFNALETQPDVELRYVKKNVIPPNKTLKGKVQGFTGDPDILIIPGSKNTIEDLLYLRETGLEKKIIDLHKKGKIIIGICGGYQMLGKKIHDPHHMESDVGSVEGIGLLDIETIFEDKKATNQVEGHIEEGDSWLLNGLGGCRVEGYEIHMGKSALGENAIPFTRITKKMGKPLDIIDGVMNKEGNVMGTFIHGIFDSIDFTRGMLNNIRKSKDLEPIKSEVRSIHEFKEKEYDRLASIVRKNLDMEKIYRIMGL